MRIEIPTNKVPNTFEIINIPMPFAVAEFEKVSFEQFKEAMIKNHFGDLYKDYFQEIYNDIKIPERATEGSAGYDFFSPVSFVPPTGNGIVIPTGIRCNIEPGWVLQMYPRSGQGFKFGVHLYNTVGIIDQDYYYADNEGHIMIKITAKEQCKTINMGEAFCQGIFLPFGITKNDKASGTRTGGFGSTDK